MEDTDPDAKFGEYKISKLVVNNEHVFDKLRDPIWRL